MTYSSTLAYYTINFSYFYSTYAKRQVFENHTAMMAWYHFRAEKKYSGKKLIIYNYNNNNAVSLITLETSLKR